MTRPPSRVAAHADGARRMWLRRRRAVLDVGTGKRYPTAKDAASAIGCAPSLVCMALAGKVPAAKGHKLQWAVRRAETRGEFRGGAAPSLPRDVVRSGIVTF